MKINDKLFDIRRRLYTYTYLIPTLSDFIGMKLVFMVFGYIALLVPVIGWQGLL